MIRYRGYVILRPTAQEEVERLLALANADRDEFSVHRRDELIEYLREPGAKAWARLNPYDDAIYGKRSIIWGRSEEELEQLANSFDYAATREYP